MTNSSETIKSGRSPEPTVDLLFEQALTASLQRQSEVAVPLLIQILARDPYHAKARHLLGAEYAQAGKMNEAIIEIGAALELNPDMPLARFQLGLMLLTSTRVADAEQVWNALDGLGSAHVLNRFRHAMLLIVYGNPEQARLNLAATISDNVDFPALNHEMLVVIEMIVATTNSRQETQISADANDDTELGEQHFLVSSYVQSPTVH